MKTTLAFSTVVSAIASSVLLAADSSPTTALVDLPFTRIEVTVALKQYEKIRGLLLDAELDRKLQTTDPNIAKEKSAALDMRIEILNSELKKLRTFAEDALKVVRETLERERVTLEQIRAAFKIHDPDTENPDIAPWLPDPRNGGIEATIAAKNEVGNYMERKARYLKVRSQWQKLDSLCEEALPCDAQR